jgi:hypothetical protein
MQPNHMGLLSSANGSEFGVEPDCLSVKGSIDDLFKKRLS